MEVEAAGVVKEVEEEKVTVAKLAAVRAFPLKHTV